MARSPSPRPAGPKAASKKKKAARTKPRAGIEAAIAALREEVACLRKEIPRAVDHEPLIAEAAGRVRAARAAIGEALATLPRDKNYASAAAHLRELATVSPSLMEWMKELPALSMPLAESIAALEAAARELKEAEQGLRRLL